MYESGIGIKLYVDINIAQECNWVVNSSIVL